LYNSQLLDGMMAGLQDIHWADIRHRAI